MSPVRAFLVLLAVLVTAGVILWVTTRPERSKPIRVESAQPRSDNAATKEPEPTEATRPTKAEAKAIFEKLDQARIRAYRRRNLQHISRFLTSNSPIEKTVRSEISRLREDAVLDRTVFETKKLRVKSATARQIELLQVVVIEPKFISESGNDLTIGNTGDRDTIEWLLRKEDRGWLIHNGFVLDRKRIRTS